LSPPAPPALARAAAAARAGTARRFDGPGALAAGAEWLAAPVPDGAGGGRPPGRLLYLLAAPEDVALAAAPRGAPRAAPGPESWSCRLAAGDFPAVFAKFAEGAFGPLGGAGPGRAESLPGAIARLLAAGPGRVRVVVEVPGRAPPRPGRPTGRQAYQEMVDSWRAGGAAALLK